MDTNIKQIIITEVGTRDGFQSEKKTIDTKDKVSLINDLIQSGFKRIEFSSFVSPKAIPPFISKVTKPSLPPLHDTSASKEAATS